VLDRDHPIVIVADPGRENESAVRLGRIGFDHVVGYLEGGLRSLEARPDLTATTDRLSPAVAADRLAGGGAVAVDVRTPNERTQKYVDGSLAIPLSQLLARLHDIPRDRPVIVYCAGGYRSSIAASLLQKEGFPDVSEVAGGIAAWETAHLPVHV
jgi:rhodanese-related sulfurtransferase